MFGIFKKPKPDGLVALSAKELLKPYGHLIGQIHQHVAVPETHWKEVYLQFIDNFATQVQLLPASESHHHSSAGGLLTHSLEVGLNALKFRKSKMLPLGATITRNSCLILNALDCSELIKPNLLEYWSLNLSIH